MSRTAAWVQEGARAEVRRRVALELDVGSRLSRVRVVGRSRDGVGGAAPVAEPMRGGPRWTATPGNIRIFPGIAEAHQLLHRLQRLQDECATGALRVEVVCVEG
ncbi:hypothetical protein GCM10022255_016410 [Dactylosporangium darangshiense]|uniref:Uncharacterized protein n=1 Tax=Dactylosporangium darangshiense TaxID=579108 RepID=A0ABP8D206_9ACTN